jgi:predicted component of type VI protein secretion system
MLPESTTKLNGLRKWKNDSIIQMYEKQILQLQIRIISAKDFAPHKVAYYEEQLKELQSKFK